MWSGRKKASDWLREDSCGECRACWDGVVATVAYRLLGHGRRLFGQQAHREQAALLW
jgi:NADH:ubiquinone oxidoreductase subunit F (NADH-binding)